MVAMAKAAQIGGAIGIRANGIADVSAIKKAIDLPVIGINKRLTPGFDVFITPALSDALAVWQAGADIIAIDGTRRPRPDDLTLAETIRELHAKGVAVMADISTFEEGMHAAEAGADIVSTTLSGYTPYSKQSNEPDLSLVSQLATQLSVPVVAEGRIKTPREAARAIEAGAYFVVVGSAITRPQWITATYKDEIERMLRLNPPAKRAKG
jgi:N-acylglucosamine-6-phosphate 2-epimerase